MMPIINPYFTIFRLIMHVKSTTFGVQKFVAATLRSADEGGKLTSWAKCRCHERLRERRDEEGEEKRTKEGEGK